MSAKELTQGRWYAILTQLGIHSDFLTGKKGPCPKCGGKDRFHWDNKEDRGTYYCQRCGAGDGFGLLKLVHGWDFRTTLQEVKRVVSFCHKVSPPRQNSNRAREFLREVMRGARTPFPGGPVIRYLASRGLEVTPALYEHRALKGHESGRIFPGMLAIVKGPDGTDLTLHRTYLTNRGTKAPNTCRKLMPVVDGKSTMGGAIRLFEPGDTLAIAEGIETALAVHVITGLPVWATVSANGMEKFEPPDSVERLCIYGDNDISQTGQFYAYSLSKRLVKQGRDAQVFIPQQVGDWNDVLREMRRAS